MRGTCQVGRDSSLSPSGGSIQLPERCTQAAEKRLRFGKVDSVRALTLINLNTGAQVTPTASYANDTVTYSLGAAPLSNGNYAAILRGSMIQSTADGIALVGSDNVIGDDYVFGSPASESGTAPPGMYYLQGDLDLTDRAINLSDFLTLSRNFGQSGVGYSSGDINYDGTVNLASETTANVYDNGGVGDGNLTQSTQIPGSNQPNRVTDTAYDFRDRAVFSEAGAGAAAGTHPPLTYIVYDNLDEPTDVRVFDADGLTFSNIASSDLSSGVYSGDLRAYKQNAYDDLGRVYQSLTHNIDQSTGADAGALATNTFYDPRGDTMAVFSPNGLAAKSVYDGAGRVVTQYTSDGGGTNNGGVQVVTYAGASGVANDVVLQQVETQYDKDGNPTFVITFQRHHDDVQLGALHYDLTNGYTHARISFASSYYDEADRLITSIDWGNMGNDGATIYSAPTQTFTAPAAQPRDAGAVSGWDQWLRTDYQYDSAGQQAIVIDPRGIATRTFRDSLGRTTDVTEAYTGSILSNDPSADGVTIDQNRKTQTQYNGADGITARTSITFDPANPTVPNGQTTTYTYGVSKGGNNAISSNTLLSVTTYGLAADPAGSTLPRVTGLDANNPDVQNVGGYDALGEITQQLNRDGTTHAFQFDSLGRQTDDKVTNVAAFSAGQISTWADEKHVTYDALGRPVELTMLKAGVALDDVYNTYDGLGELTKQYQAHSGSALGADGKPTGPVVQYTFEQNYAKNYSRQTNVIYPDGRVVSYSYGFDTYPLGGTTAGTFLASLNGAISRVGYVVDGLTDAPQYELEDYDYLGLNTVVTRDRPNSTGTLHMSYIANNYQNDNLFGAQIALPPGGYTGHDDAGTQDPYDGLDRFGRVVDQGWNGSVEYFLSYDADGNELAQQVASTQIDYKWKSEIFHAQGAAASGAYDQLNRLQYFYRGIMNPDEMSVAQGVIYVVHSNGQTETVPTNYVSQDFYGVSSAGDYAQTPPDPAHASDLPTDNVYQKPLPAPSTEFSIAPNGENQLDERDMFLNFDAFEQMANQSQAYLVGDANTGKYYYTGSFKNDYEYDALGRRISETTTNRNGNVTATDLFYAAGNVVEEDQSSPGFASSVLNEYVWSPVQSGTMILRDGGGQRVWPMQGPDGSTWATELQSSSLSLFNTEQYVYNPAGQVGIIDYFRADQFAEYSFNLNSQFDWRYLWEGGRSGRDQTSRDGNPLEDASYVNAFDGTYLMPNGATYDSYTGVQAPMQTDKYAFFRDSGNAADINANQYGTRSVTNVTYGYNGTTSNAQDMQLQSDLQGLEGGFEAALTFAGSFVSNVASELGGIGERIYNSIAHPINTYTNVMTSVAGVMTRTLGAIGNEGFGASTAAFATGTAYALSSVTGLTGIAEGLYGQNFSTGQNLSTEERFTTGLGGLSALAFLGSAVVGGGLSGRPAIEPGPLSYLGGQPLDLTVAVVGRRCARALGQPEMPTMLPFDCVRLVHSSGQGYVSAMLHLQPTRFCEPRSELGSSGLFSQTFVFVRTWRNLICRC